LLVKHVLQVEHSIEGADPRCEVPAHGLGHLDHPKLLADPRHDLCLPPIWQPIENRLHWQIPRVFRPTLQLEDVLQAVVVPVQLLDQLHPLLPGLVHGKVLGQELLCGLVHLGSPSPQHCCLVLQARVWSAREPAQVDEDSGSKWQVVLEWLVLHWPVQMGALEDVTLPDLVEVEEHGPAIPGLQVEQPQLLRQVLGHPRAHCMVRRPGEGVCLVLRPAGHCKELLTSLVVELADEGTAAISRRVSTIHPNCSRLQPAVLPLPGIEPHHLARGEGC